MKKMLKKDLKNLEEVETFLSKHIPIMTDRFFGVEGIKKMKYFLHLLGDPQEKLKVIHIAGTSGKSSTAFLTSLLLTVVGFKTGLHLSPHLLDIRERCQIDNKLLDEKEFVNFANEILQFVEEMEKTKYGKLTYFEIMVGLTFYIFQKKKVDYAIIETGLGGTYDGTNIVENNNKLVILTKVGKDHTEVLGETMEEIASNKAGIIQNKNVVISTKQKEVAEKIISQVCRDKQAELHRVNYWNDVDLNLRGRYQQENCALALKAVSLLSRRDGFEIDKKKIKKALGVVNLRGRFDIIERNGKTLILDGAHNPQKMKAFIGSLKKLYPQIKFNFLVAFKVKKDFQSMLKLIIPIAEKITVTNFQINSRDQIFSFEKNQRVMDFLQEIKYKNCELVNGSEEALKKCLKYDNGILVITGSFYLLSEIYLLDITFQNRTL